MSCMTIGPAGQLRPDLAAEIGNPLDDVAPSLAGAQSGVRDRAVDRLRQLAEGADAELVTLGDGDDALVPLLERAADVEDFGAFGEPAGHGLSPCTGVRARLGGRETDRPRVQRLADEPAHFRDFVSGRRALGGFVAQHVRAQRRVADHDGDIQPGLLPLHRVEVLRERLEVPWNAGGQGVDRHSFDVLEGAGDRFAMLWLGRRDAEAAIAHDHGRDPVPAGRSQIRIPQHLRVVVRVTVDESRREHQAVEVDNFSHRWPSLRPSPRRSGHRRSRRPPAACGAPVPSMSSAFRSTIRGSVMHSPRSVSQMDDITISANLPRADGASA